MKKVKLILDSGANQGTNLKENIQVVPLTLNIDGQDFLDDDQLDLTDFVNKMLHSKSPGKTACPSIDDWLAALDGSEYAIIMTITSRLSGSYSSALQAKKIYQEKNPSSQVIVVDTRSAGPEMQVILEKIKQWVKNDKLRFVDLEEKIANYQTHTHLLAILQSLHNLAVNGRISPAMAKMASMLKINAVITASEEGVIKPLAKIRGMKRAIKDLFSRMEKMHFKGGRVVIDHCQNEKDALNLKEKILAKFPKAEIIVRSMKGLCAFYVEKGGLMIGFEG